MQDFLNLDSYLTEDEKFIRETISRFAMQEAQPLFLEAFEQGEFPSSLIPTMGSLGLFGMTLPQHYGGSEASYLAYGLACQELERCDSGLRSFVSVQSSLCMYPIFAYGSDEQKDQFLKPMAEGKCIGAFGLTEPDSGSDPSSMRTYAKKVAGGWMLNGSKMWITNAPIANIAIVWARTDEGIRGFLVERDFKGFSTQTIHHKMSLRASLTGELIFDQCFVPDSHFLPGSVKGLAAPLSCLTKARYGIAWGAIGAAMDCFDTALAYTKERQQFGKPIASFQLIQNDLVEMFNDIVSAQCVNLQLARLADSNHLTHEMVSLGKRNACQKALNIARKARNLLGANGISLEYNVARHMTNLESVFTYEGTHNVHTLILGRYLTGIDALSCNY